MTRARILAVGLLEHVRRHDWRCARHRSRRRPLRPSAEPPTLSGKDISEATLLIRVLAASLLIALGSSSLTALEVSNVVLLPTRLRVSRPHSQPADRIRTARKRSNASLDALPTEMEGLAACRGAPDARSPRRVFLTRIEKLNAAPQCSDASAQYAELASGTFVVCASASNTRPIIAASRNTFGPPGVPRVLASSGSGCWQTLELAEYD